MEFFLSGFVFLFGILTWIPFLNNVYSQDMAAAMYWVDRMKKGDLTFYKDAYLSPIGHLMHIILMQFFWEKENTKAFYWIMCLYVSLSAVVLYWLIDHLFGLLPAVIGSMLFSLYMVSPRLDGNWGPTEQLLPLPLMASALCILTAPAPHSHPLIFLSGMFFGYSILIKQVAVLYLPGYVLILVGSGHAGMDLPVFLGGAIAINLIPLVYFSVRHHAFWEYLTCMWLHLLPSAIHPRKYNKFYPKVQVQGQKPRHLIRSVILQNSRSLPPLLFPAVVGIVLLLAWNPSFLYAGFFACLLASLPMVAMRGTFFPHYWLNMIPWLAIFAGYALGEMGAGFVREGPPGAASLAGVLAIFLLILDAIRVDRKYYSLSKDPYQFLRRIWGEEMVKAYKSWRQIGEYIKKTTRPEDRILICGWVPHILLYSDRTHFTPEPCLYSEDYLDIYHRKNPVIFDFLNSVYHFKNFKIVKQRENIFHTGYPEILVFHHGEADVESFEKLTGMKYSQDENLPGYPLYRADPELSELLSPLEKGNKGTAHRPVEDLLKLGEDLIQSGKLKLLIHFYNRLIMKRLVPEEDALRLLNKVGEVYVIQGRYHDAEELFRKLSGIVPHDLTVLNNLGVVCFHLGKREQATAFFQKVLAAEPGNGDALFNLNQLGTQPNATVSF